MTLDLQYLVGIPARSRASISDRCGAYVRKRSGSRLLARSLVAVSSVFLPTAIYHPVVESIPARRAWLSAAAARRGTAQHGAAGMARRGAARRGSTRRRCTQRGTVYRAGLNSRSRRSAGATRHVSTIEHGRNEAITRARIHIYPVARKRGDSVRARARGTEIESEREKERKRERAEQGDGKRK